MPRGGYRPNAGRPKGSASSKLTTPVIPGITVHRSGENTEVSEIQSGWLTPLEYMLSVINDASADQNRRDRMAIASAPYVHSRPADVKLGKKEMAEKAAKDAGAGSDWGDDLAPCVKLN